MDFHIYALEAFGAKIEHYENKYVASKTGTITNGCEITHPYPSGGNRNNVSFKCFSSVV